MVTQVYSINQSGPTSSMVIKASDVWTGSCTIFIILAIMEVTIVGYRENRRRHEEKYNNDIGIPNKCVPPISDELDIFSMMLFPLGFILFNFAYWYYYLYA
jgi:hypothetical protein